jgi:apolipoprotein D and lipocalin family protein
MRYINKCQANWWPILIVLLLIFIYIQYLKWNAVETLSVSNLNGLFPVDTFDVERYLGDWYEHSRFDHSFERGLSEVRASYTINTNNAKQLIVENRGIDCRRPDRQPKYIRGFAVQTDKIGVLAVSFFPFIKSMYVMLFVDPEYQYAVVGSPNRKALWYLTRNSNGTIPAAMLQQMNAITTRNLFDVKLLQTLQPCV